MTDLAIDHDTCASAGSHPVAVSLDHELTALHGDDGIDAAALPFRRGERPGEELVDGRSVEPGGKLPGRPLLGRPRNTFGLGGMPVTGEHPAEPRRVEGIPSLLRDLERRRAGGSVVPAATVGTSMAASDTAATKASLVLTDPSCHPSSVG